MLNLTIHQSLPNPLKGLCFILTKSCLVAVQLCSMTMVTGLFICLRSAAKITHKAQSVASLAAKWHACATLSSFDDQFGDETPVDRTVTPPAIHPVDADWENDDDEEGDGDDELDNTNMVPVHARTISYHKRQALGQYGLLNYLPTLYNP